MEFSWHTILLAFGLTLLAGLSTGVGSLIAYFTKRTSKKFLSLALGFSAGVMLFVSFVEIYPESREAFMHDYEASTASFFTLLSFFAGMALIALVDRLIPSYENPHEVRSVEEMSGSGSDQKLLRMGMLSAIAIAIHNFPEGFATFVSGLSNLDVAIPITVAIALHNIPEGIAVSVPIYFATGSKRKALKYSMLSGLSEPLGAVIGFVVVYSLFGISPVVLGVLWGLISGIMVFISLDELLPTAKEYGAHHLSIYGLIAGMAVMGLSLWLNAAL